MTDAERHRLRATFEEVPELYERARPLYPRALFDDLVSIAGLRRGSRVLEIGCGTGQATDPLADRGFDVVCVELGKGLATIATRKLAARPNVQVVNTTFEAWEPPPEAFDAVTAFTAFHWVDPESRYEKPARLLRPGGWLAVADTKHVLTESGDPFWVEVQSDYDAVVPSDENQPPPRPEDVADRRGEMESSGRFGEIVVRRYLSDVIYTADEYVAVLDTYSGHRTLAEPTRRALYDRIRRRIEAQPGAAVRKTYLFTLTAARRLR